MVQVCLILIPNHRILDDLIEWFGVQYNNSSSSNNWLEIE